jgi:hypothetical protein
MANDDQRPGGLLQPVDEVEVDLHAEANLSKALNTIARQQRPHGRETYGRLATTPL